MEINTIAILSIASIMAIVATIFGSILVFQYFSNRVDSYNDYLRRKRK